MKGILNNFGTGALPDVSDERDYKAEPLFAATPPVDWENGITLPRPSFWGQQTSDSCVSAAWSYYHWQHKPDKDFCRKSIFAYIAQSYGAYIRDGGLRIVKFGQEITSETPDPEIRTPETMRDKTGLSEKDAEDDRALDSYSLPNTIDDVAKCVRDFKGCVFGITGDNGFFSNLAEPPIPINPKWGHALYIYGFHLHNGQKCVIARSSWSEIDHHIKENWFINGFTFNPWVLIPRKELMNQAKIVKSKNSDTVYWCYPMPSMEYLKEKASLEGVQIPDPIPNTDTL